MHKIHIHHDEHSISLAAPFTLTAEEGQRLKEFCEQSGIISSDPSPEIDSAGIDQLIGALRDRLPQITSSVDLERFFNEVRKLACEIEAKIHGTALRDEEE